MTILHPKPIIDKLEKDGVETVKAKVAKNLYRPDKLVLVKKWLAENDKGKKIGRPGVLIHAGKSTITLTGDPNEIMEGSQDPDETKDKDMEGGQWPDAKTLALASKTDKEYKVADPATKRKITMARKKLAAAKEPKSTRETIKAMTLK